MCTLPYNFKAYLEKFKMHNFHNAITKHGVCTELCTVPHAVETAIPTPNCTFQSPYLLNEGIPVCFPVLEDSWEHKL